MEHAQPGMKTEAELREIVKNIDVYLDLNLLDLAPFSIMILGTVLTTLRWALNEQNEQARKLTDILAQTRPQPPPDPRDPMDEYAGSVYYEKE